MKLHLSNDSLAGWRTIATIDGEPALKVARIEIVIDANNINEATAVVRSADIESKEWVEASFHVDGFDMDLSLLQNAEDRSPIGSA